MLHTITEILGCIFNVLLMGIFIRGFFNLKKSTNIYMMICAHIIFCLCLSVLSLFPSLVIPRMIFTLLGFVVIVILFYQSTLLQAIVSSLLFYALVAIVDMCSLSILQLFGVSVEAMMRADSTRVVFIVFSNMLYTVCILMAVSFSRKEGKSFSFLKILPFLPCEILSIAVCCMILLQSADTEPSLWVLLYLAVLLYLNMTAILYTELVQQMTYRQQHFEMIEKQYSLQRDYYKKIHDSREETQALWHDLKKYLLAIKTASKTDSSEESQDAIRQFEDMLDEVTSIVETGNTQVDTVLTYYLNQAKNRDIPVSMDISIPPLILVSTIDLYVIIGNTFENAMEACSSLPSECRYIKIKLKMQGSMLYYSIENPYVENKIHFQGKYHGYGLKNVQKTLAKYSGTMEITQGASFTCSIRLNCPAQ